MQARIQVQLSDIHGMLGRTDPEALEECEAAAAVLDAEGDLEGLAEAWVTIGSGALYFGDAASGREDYERAVTYARRKRQPPRETGRRRAGCSAAFRNCPSRSMRRSAARSNTSKQHR